MKQTFKLTRLWVASLLLLFGVSQPTWAADVQKDAIIYFDNSVAGWNYSYTYFAIAGSDNNSTLYKMSVISNTKLYVHKRSDNTWGGYNYVHLFAASGDWGSSGGSWSNMAQHGSNLSLFYNNYGFNANNLYIIKLSGKGSTSDPKSISISYAGSAYSSMNKTITVKAKVSTNNGSSYSDVTTSPGTLSASSKKFTEYNSCSSSTSLSSGKISCGYTATTTLTAADATGYTFVGWYNSSGTQQTTNKTLTIYPTADATYYAYYKENRYDITATVNDANMGSATPTTATAMGQISGGNITATNNPGYHFVNWTLGTAAGTFGSSSTASTTFKPTQAGTVVANFAENTHSVTISDDGNGSTSPSGAQTVGEVTGIEITATPATDYGFKEWVCSGGSVVGQTATTTFYPTADNATIKATFQSTAVYYTWAFGVHSSGGGNVSSNVAAGSSVRGGTAITLTATPNTGYEVDGWYDNQDCTGQALQTGQNTYSFTISGNSVRYVKFKKIDFAITYTTQSTGWTYGGSNPTKANYGDQVSFVVNQTAGYTVSVTSSDATLDATGAPTYTFTMPAKAVAISVSATENMTTVTVNANQTSWGTISGAVTSWGATTTAGVATSRTLTAAAKSGYKFARWELADGATSTSTLTNASITIKGDGSSATGTATAIFEEDLSCDWYIEGDASIFGGWQTSGKKMSKKPGHSTEAKYYVTITPSKTASGENDFEFQVYNSSENKDYGYNNYWITKSANSTYVYTGNPTNMKFRPDIKNEEYEFELDCTGTNPKLTVKWPSVNALNSNFSGSWAQTKGTVEGDVLTVQYEVTDAMLSRNDMKFKMIFDGDYYGAEGEGYGITPENHTDWTLATPGHDIGFTPSVAGVYTFTFNKSTKKFSATYPAAQTFTVTMAVDGPGTTTPAGSVELNAFTGTEITATPTEHSGYHFKNWTGTDGITFADANNATTTAKATGTGTITAHFEKDTYIYFNNTIAQKWTKEPIYIYLYKGDGYWDNAKGTGAQEDGNYMGRFAMTKLPNTEIWSWHYDQLHGFQDGDKITYVAFSNSDMAGYQYFYNAQAVYKYYNDCMNMFVPDASQTPERLNNNTDYYNAGFWRKYNDTSSKMYLHIWDVTAGKELDGDGYELTTKTAGNDAFNAPVKLGNNHQYNIYIGSCDGKNYSRETTIYSDKCSGIQLFKYDKIDDKRKLAYLNTGAGGNYVFTLTYDNDKMTLSIEYPVTANDYRVKTGTPTRYSNIIRSTEPSGTISMFLNAGINTLTYEEATNVDVDPIVWGNTKSINVNVANAGVYTMTLTKGETPTITNVQPYTGKYYVRTDCAQGGWNEYKTNDNNLMRFTDRNPKFVDNPLQGFNYYYCRWNENAEGNVRFVVANEINACISDTMKADAILDDTEFLKGKANIRFSWNSNTNALNRAYISGSYDDAEYLQIRSVGNKLFKKQDGSEPITDAKLDDNNDWTYIIDVYADGQARAAVSAKYNNKYQFFVGNGDASTGEVTNRVQIIAQADKAHMQLVYDFKTDRIVTGWIPGDVITADITLQSDAILTRVHQGQLSPIKFSSDGISVLEVQTMYGVLQLDKSEMTDGHTQTDKLYERNIYWISFPFDVRVGDIFGVDGYGTKWVMQRYNGAKRAEIGWFKETDTFWEYMDQNDIMEANVGYTLTLDPDYFDNASDAMWANSKTSVSFYFPSITHNINVVSNGQAESSIPAHECKIDRTFDDGNKNHKTTDSHWNVIGIPTFQDLKQPDFDVKSVYKWDPATNTYSIQVLSDFTLEASHAYFVQWGREELVTWPNASIIKPSTAPYAYADAKNYMVELFFSYGDKEDHTYINLKDEAKQDFVLNEDMMKVTNSGQPNIYSYAGAYDVAYNATTLENQTVNLGVIARKNGSYTFSMPKDFSGSAILVDLEEGTFTDLNVSNYSVDLNKGTYNNRFQLMLEVEAKIPTNIENANGEWNADGKTKKLLINDQIYLINGGRVYNATGTMVK